MTEAIALVTYSEVTEYPSPHLKCEPRGRKERVCFSVSAGIPSLPCLPGVTDGSEPYWDTVGTHVRQSGLFFP